MESSSDVTAQLMRNNERYAAAFSGGELAPAPRLKTAIVTCMDARIDPARILGLEPGDTHVIRNAGGVVTDDVIRSLAISQHELGTREILVIQHTRCGLLGLDDEALARQLEQAAGSRPPWPAGGFSDLEASVREGTGRLRDSPFLVERDRVRGFVYEVESGRVREVS
jgi:carbonic anhydrase